MSQELQQYNSYYPVNYDYVDQLPTGWRLLPNIGIFQERIERGYPDEELLSVTIGRGVIKQTELDKKDSSTLDKSKYLLVYPNDLVYSMRFRQGASGYSNYKGIVSPACTVLKSRKGIKLNPRYFYYLFRTEFYKNYVERFSYGIADGQIPLRYTDFKRMYSIVPPLDIQNAIVAYLDKKNEEIEKFISNKELLIQLLEESKSNAIREYVTKGVKSVEFKLTKVGWLGDIPEHWCLKRMRYLCKIETGTKNTEDRDDTGIYPFFVRSQNIERINSYSFDGEAILTAGDGVGVGKVFHYINGKFDFHQRVYKFSNFKGILGQYLFYYLRANFHNVALLGDAKSTVDSLRLPLIKDFEISFPPIMDEQIEIVNFVKKEEAVFDSTISKAKQEILSIKEYRESLITNLITGQKAVLF